MSPTRSESTTLDLKMVLSGICHVQRLIVSVPSEDVVAHLVSKIDD